MANVLDEEKQKQILALGRLGWTLRRIEQETGVRRETASRYLKKAGIEVRPSGRWGHPEAKAAIKVITDSGGDSKAAIEVITFMDSFDRGNRFQGRVPLRGGPEGRAP